MYDQDRDHAFNLLLAIARRIMPEYRFVFPQMDWWKDNAFNNYLKKFEEERGCNTQRRWMVKQLLRLVSHLNGDTVECGVYKGAGSWTILEANKESIHTKKHHIFDSFEGLGTPTEKDHASYWKKGDLSVGAEVVIENLSPFENGKDFLTYKGWIPERFHDIKDIEISFIHVDVDLEQPTIDSLEYFYPKLQDGGIFLCDDYGFDTCPGATKVIDDFLEDKVEKMISLADGGGFFIKGQQVSKR
jgi:hypothetical protein